MYDLLRGTASREGTPRNTDRSSIPKNAYGRGAEASCGYTDTGHGHNSGPDAFPSLDGPLFWRFFIWGIMSAILMVIPDAFTNESPKVRFVETDHMG